MILKPKSLLTFIIYNRIPPLIFLCTNETKKKFLDVAFDPIIWIVALRSLLYHRMQKGPITKILDVEKKLKDEVALECEFPPQGKSEFLFVRF